MQPVRIGVIGCGVMGDIHATQAAQQDEMTLTAVADVREDVAKAIGEKHGAQTVYTDVDALLPDKDIEAVTIALPAGIRGAIALRAFEAGKHVFLEKPVAMNVGEVEQMISVRGELVGAVASCRYRCFESAKVATDVVARGELGDIRIVHFRGMLQDGGPKSGPIPAWRVSRKLNGGGFWVNWACYDMDYLMGVTGWSLKPKLVLAQTWPISDYLPDRVAEGSDAEEHALALVHCEGGAVMSMERGESLAIDVPSTWNIIGSKAALRLDMFQAEGNQVLLDRSHPDGKPTTEVVWEGDNDQTAVHREPLVDYAMAIREGRDPLTSLERGLVLQKITDAIYQSADEGRAVEIS